MKPINKNQDNMKKVKNILSDITSNKDNKDFDVLFLVDATGSMGSYIISAKEETKNISKELRKQYPDRNFKYGYIFYRDPIDSKGDTHEIIDLTDNVNSIPERISHITAFGGGDLPEDWAGAYKLANEKISWRDGEKVIMHLADAGAHGKRFTLSDKYPNEESKLIQELEKCAAKKISVFGFVIENDSLNSFNECAKIYRSHGGFYEVSDFCLPEVKEEMNRNMMKNNMMMGCNMMMNNNMLNNNMMNNNMMMGSNMMMNNMMNNNMMMNNMMNMNAPPMMNMNMNMQMMNNMNFNRNAINSIGKIINK